MPGSRALTVTAGWCPAGRFWLKWEPSTGWSGSVSSGETGPELRTDEELQELITGELRPHNAPITLAEYDPGWPGLFAREAARIRAVLGDIALRIDR